MSWSKLKRGNYFEAGSGGFRRDVLKELKKKSKEKPKKEFNAKPVVTPPKI